MTITELTPRRKDKEPVQRFEVFTGTGRRREWGEDEKRQIIEESYSSDLSVCAMARRHGLSSSQLFAWRGAAREQQQERAGLLPMFVPAIVASPEAPSKNKVRRPRSVKSSSRAAAIETEIGDISAMLRTAFSALKRNAAAGVYGLKWQAYEQDLDRRIEDLRSRFIWESIGHSATAELYSK